MPSDLVPEVGLVVTGVTVFLCIFTLFLLTLRLHQRKALPSNLPPGPRPWPVVGNLFQMGEQLHLSLTNLRAVYGDVFRVKMGSLEVVVLSGPSTIRQALVRQGEAFAGRPELFTFTAVSDGNSMTFSEKYGEAWTLHKKICKNALRTFSQAKARNSSSSCLLEERISEEVLEIVEALREQGEKVGDEGLDPTALLAISVANVACALCFGKRYNHNDEQFLTIVNINNEVLKIFASGNLADFFPVFRYLPSPSLRKVVQYIHRMNCFMEDHIKEHLLSFDKNCIRDITDALIELCEDRQEDRDRAMLTDSQIIHTVIDIFGAGFDTIITGLQWSLLYLIKFPHIRTRICQEIGTKTLHMHPTDAPHRYILFRCSKRILEALASHKH